MPGSIASLIAQPGQSGPQQQQGNASGGDMATSLASLLQGQGGGQGGQGGGQPQAQAPNHQETVMALQHLSVFQQKWKALLANPDIGKKNIRGDVLEVMADVMGDGLVTLPQVMTQLKQFPDDPLQQRQWVEKHYENGKQAMQAILIHHGQGHPRVGPWPVEKALADASMQQGDDQGGKPGANDNHLAMMGTLAKRYRGK